MEFELRRLFPPEPLASRMGSRRSKKHPSSNDLSERKIQFLELVRKLHHYYQDQMNAALVSTRKFELATRYFIRALRKIQPLEIGATFSTLSELEESIASWKQQDKEADTGAADLRSILQSFLKNITNFRILRQHVKMEIMQTLKQLPEEYEDGLQTRTRGEMDVLLSAWTGLVNRDNDFTKLTHPSIQSYHDYFLNEQEMTCFCGVLSILPKLVDIINRFDHLLIKYQMGTSTM